MPEQLSLRYEGRSAADEAWEYVLGHVREAVAQIGLAQVAAELDVTASQLSHALNKRERHYFRAEWLLFVIYRAPSPELLRAIADLRDHDIVERKPLEPSEELDAVYAALERQFGVEVRRVILAEARKLARRER
jgi:hypothetical protein